MYEDEGEGSHGHGILDQQALLLRSFQEELEMAELNRYNAEKGMKRTANSSTHNLPYELNLLAR